MPPGQNGFVFANDTGRVYFDLDSRGKLVEIDDLAGETLNLSGDELPLTARMTRWISGHSILFQRFKRSRLAMWLAVHYGTFSGCNLWPGGETVLRRELQDLDAYRWALFEKVLHQLGEEARESGREVMRVNIPYRPQVYDEVWQASFGSLGAEYDREIGSGRLPWSASARVSGSSTRPRSSLASRGAGAPGSTTGTIYTLRSKVMRSLRRSSRMRWGAVDC